jgi:hypothetical protein
MAGILFVTWLVGAFIFAVGRVIHLLLVLAVLCFVVRKLTGRRDTVRK